MILNLFEKEDMLGFHYGPVTKLIQDLRARHLADGGDPVDFPEYLAECGVCICGTAVVISDEFNTMATLKFGGRK